MYERKNMTIICLKRENRMMEGKNGTNGKGGEDAAMNFWEDNKAERSGEQNEV